VTAVLVDSNVLLDVLIGINQWAAWSRAMLRDTGDSAVLVINPVIYAEISVDFDSIDELDDAIPPENLRREPLPFAAAFLAGKAFQAYRGRGGVRRSPLPDFYIGAHAAVCGYRLLTRDAARYRTYFPTVELIAPRAQ
jgi:predicted nucleic acid-binding protein